MKKRLWMAVALLATTATACDTETSSTAEDRKTNQTSYFEEEASNSATSKEGNALPEETSSGNDGDEKTGSSDKMPGDSGSESPEVADKTDPVDGEKKSELPSNCPDVKPLQVKLNNNATSDSLFIVPQTMSFFAALDSGKSCVKWGQFSTKRESGEDIVWKHLLTGDFNGDGLTDVAAAIDGRVFWLGLNSGTNFVNKPFGQLVAGLDWANAEPCVRNIKPNQTKDSIVIRPAGKDGWTVIEPIVSPESVQTISAEVRLSLDPAEYCYREMRVTMEGRAPTFTEETLRGCKAGSMFLTQDSRFSCKCGDKDSAPKMYAGLSCVWKLPANLERVDFVFSKTFVAIDNGTEKSSSQRQLRCGRLDGGLSNVTTSTYAGNADFLTGSVNLQFGVKCFVSFL